MLVGTSATAAQGLVRLLRKERLDELAQNYIICLDALPFRIAYFSVVLRIISYTLSSFSQQPADMSEKETASHYCLLPCTGAAR
jgi:hypothetical protein